MRIAIVSDIHANLPALEAVLDDAGTVDGIWCPGDIVGYGPNPNECVDVLRERGAVCVAGNHDWAAIGRLSTEAFNADAATAAHWTAEQLRPENRLYIEELPLRSKQGDFTFVHGTPQNPIWEYLLTSASADAAFSLVETRYCLVGHTHLPTVFVQIAAGKPSRPFGPTLERPLRLGQEHLIMNPGSVGQPRDGNPAASYAMYSSDDGTVQYRRVPYDVERTQRLMQAHNLPARLWQRLSYGW